MKALLDRNGARGQRASDLIVVRYAANRSAAQQMGPLFPPPPLTRTQIHGTDFEANESEKEREREREREREGERGEFCFLPHFHLSSFFLSFSPIPTVGEKAKEGGGLADITEWVSKRVACRRLES